MREAEPLVFSGSGQVRGASAAVARRTMAVFDFDGTLTRSDSFVRFLSLVLIEYKTRLASCWGLPLDVTRHLLGWRDNTWLKQRFMNRILRGLNDNDLAPITLRLRDELLHRGFRPKAIAELRRHTALGHRTVLLSASLDIYLGPIASHLGFSDCVCTVAEREGNGILTGRLHGANCYGVEKVRRLTELIGRERELWHVVAYGDSAADLALLATADESYMVNASGTLARKSVAINARVIRW